MRTFNCTFYCDGIQLGNSNGSLLTGMLELDMIHPLMYDLLGDIDFEDTVE